MDFEPGVVGSRLFDVCVVPFRFGDSGVELSDGMLWRRSVGKHHSNRLVPASSSGRHKNQFGSDGRKQK